MIRSRTHLRGALAALAALAMVAGSALAEESAGAAPQAAEKKPAAQAADTKPDGAAISDATDPALAAIDKFIAEQNVDRSFPGWKQRLKQPPKVSFDDKTTYYWELETNRGPITIQLLPKVAPMHVSSTIYLTRLGFYDRTPFHRVIPGFMAQGGDPTGTGTGGPGYEYDGEIDRGTRHDERGILSMANTGQPTTDGSQFFLTFGPTPHLDGKHTVFGRLRAGKKTLSELEARGSRSGQPSEPLEITAASIRTQR
jgi:cyclophilin family peptidyl-prolyl cis-trans isomerase/cytochrome c5